MHRLLVSIYQVNAAAPVPAVRGCSLARGCYKGNAHHAGQAYEPEDRLRSEGTAELDAQLDTINLPGAPFRLQLFESLTPQDVVLVT
jgi:hypothetical protein